MRILHALRLRRSAVAENRSLRTRIGDALRRNGQLHVQTSTLAKENARLRMLVQDLRTERSDLIRETARAGDVAGDVAAPTDLLVLRAELRRATANLHRYEDRLAAYERRPSRIACPRACCNGGTR